jgi:hypothetical protein
MGESESSLDESGDLLRRDCLRALGFGVDGSLVVVFGPPVKFNSEAAVASLFRFEAGLRGDNSTRTVGVFVINTRHEIRCRREHTRWLDAKDIQRLDAHVGRTRGASP